MNHGDLWTLPIADGNNANTRTMSLRVMNDVTPSPEQIAEVQSLFAKHLTLLRVSLPGFWTRHFDLPDGSKVRLVSNSGQHLVQLWPVSGAASPNLESILVGVLAELQQLPPPAGTKLSAKTKFRGMTVVPQKIALSRNVDDATYIAQHPGSLTWYSRNVNANKRPVVVSWFGRATRYGYSDYYDRQRQTVCSRELFKALYGQDMYSTQSGSATSRRDQWFNGYKAAVWTNGIKHLVYKVNADGTQTAIKVISAALKHETVAGASGLYLYVLTHEAALAVYKGKMPNPYSASGVAVGKVLDIPFTVVPTGAEPYEMLVQPLYFNGSCTKLAGLVSVRNGSTTNPTAAAGGYSPVKLITVDLVAGTTTFDASAASSVTDTGSTETREWFGYTDTFYAAVDWNEDTPLVCMMLNERYHQLDHDYAYTVVSPPATFSVGAYIGSYSVTGVNGGLNRSVVLVDGGFRSTNESTLFLPDWEPVPFYQCNAFVPSRQENVRLKTVTSIRTRYRAFLSDGTVLAEKVSPLAPMDSISMETGFVNADQPLVNVGQLAVYGGEVYKASGIDTNFTPKQTRSKSGSRSENMTAPYYWAAYVEGGDLRHGLTIVTEAVEEGVSSYSGTIDVPLADKWDYGSFVNKGFAFNGSFSYTSETTGELSRAVHGRLSVWLGGSEIAHTTPANSDTIERGFSGFGMIGRYGRVNVPFVSDASCGSWFGRRNFGPGSTKPAYSGLRTSAVYNGSSFWQEYAGPLSSIGYPVMNQCAFSPDGKYGYFAAASYQYFSDKFSGVVSAELNESDHDYVAKFIIANVNAPATQLLAYSYTHGAPYSFGGVVGADGSLVLDVPAKLNFVAPVFLDNVPTRRT